jgi:hypothetical protein
MLPALVIHLHTHDYNVKISCDIHPRVRCKDCIAYVFKTSDTLSYVCILDTCMHAAYLYADSHCSV